MQLTQVQLAWKGAGRLILEEKEKLLREGLLYPTAGLHSPRHLHGDLLLSHNPHLSLAEMHSEPFGASAGGHRGMSPSIRRSSKMIASGVRKISRSFYGHGHQPQNADSAVYSAPSSPKVNRRRRMTTVAGNSPLLTPPPDTRERRNSACSGHRPLYRQVCRCFSLPLGALTFITICNQNIES